MINFGTTTTISPIFYEKKDADVWVWDRGSVKLFNFTDRTVALPETKVGYMYHVLIFVKYWDLRKSDLLREENFSCCLIEPTHYIGSLIENKYSGLVMKLQANTKPLIDEFFENYKKCHKKVLWHTTFLETFGAENVKQI